jgi:uncharacterized protein (DUF302 family)
MNPKGVTIRPSRYSVTETIDRLLLFLQKRGVTVYARINQQSEVNNTGQKIAPLQFIMFGNPEAGGPVIAENPIAALDLPLKIIAWEDNDSKVWIAYNEALYIEERYSLPHSLMGPLDLGPLISKSLMD